MCGRESCPMHPEGCCISVRDDVCLWQCWLVLGSYHPQDRVTEFPHMMFCRACVSPSCCSPCSRRPCPPSPSPSPSGSSFTSPQTTWCVLSWTRWPPTSSTSDRRAAALRAVGRFAECRCIVLHSSAIYFFFKKTFLSLQKKKKRIKKCCVYFVTRKQKLPFCASCLVTRLRLARQSICGTRRWDAGPTSLSSGMRSRVWIRLERTQAPSRSVINPSGLSRRNMCVSGDQEARSGRTLSTNTLTRGQKPVCRHECPQCFVCDVCYL